MQTEQSTTGQIMRWRIKINGIVQGVGFRPFIYALAKQLALVGFVQNDSNGVFIEVEGMPALLDSFVTSVQQQPPPLAKIDSLTVEMIPSQGSSDSLIEQSIAGRTRNTLIAADMATCSDCLHELFDPTDRRYHYPFLNCTNCGPRFTIVLDVPYDRPNTSMRIFPLCPACQAEYQNPADRRFHAQPTACPVCGPQLMLVSQTATSYADQALQETAQLLFHGQILAIKGLGGYHLACDAFNANAVADLRRRKQREAKPFALMVADLAAAKRLCLVSQAEAALLQSARRPIVLLERRPEIELPPDLAPRYSTLGVMLPYTPLHHLLLHYVGQLCQPAQPVALVMTSGNRSDEPIAYVDHDANQCLAPIATAILSHNRPIETRCDDTVTRIVAGGEQLLRRSRGYAPTPIRLRSATPQPIVAYGGHLKNTFCLTRGNQAFLSHYIGDLENLEVLSSFRAGLRHFQRLFDLQPTVAAYDLHPEYLATKEALASDLPIKIGVQHHHAHIASVLAEHGLEQPVIGIAADGTGYGNDGTIWGGEILLADLAQFERLGHLMPFAMPGGDQAVRQIWRVAAAILYQLYGPSFLELELPFVRAIDPKHWQIVARMIDRKINSPQTSSMGRLFDAVAALIGLRNEVIYEGQAAIELEAIAERHSSAYPCSILAGTPFQIDLQPIIAAIIADLRLGTAPPTIAGRFQRTIAEVLLAACQQAQRQTGVKIVALSGGVFQNRLLLETLTTLLEQANFQVFTNRQVPPNDGGLSFGQAAVAAAPIVRAEGNQRLKAENK